MNTRIKEIRLDHALNQTDFGARVGAKQTTVAGWESGNRIPTTPALLAICREFNVNEDWLRTGAGEKYMQFSRKDTISAYIGKINGGKCSPLEEKLIEFMAETSAEEWEELSRILKRFADTITKPSAE